MADILILTGPPGAGKSSVAEAVAARYDRVAHVEVDTLRHFITPTGFVAPGRPGFERQKRLATRNAGDLARNFLKERFAVIIDDVVASPSDVDEYLQALEQCEVPVHYIRLLPGLEVCQERNVSRAEGRISPERLRRVYSEFESAGESRGAEIDSSSQDAEETADSVQALTTSGRSIIWTPVNA